MTEAAKNRLNAIPVATQSSAPSGVLQRKCECGNHSTNGATCDECKKKPEGTLSRSAVGPTPAGGVPPIVHDVLQSSGRPLDSATRSFMEPRFGRDFSRVRIHDDARAAESASSVNARAYTVGQSIAFARGQYRPHTSEGAALLAHELTHTVQQGGLQRSATGSLGISLANDASEREADAAARSISGGVRPVVSTRPASLSLHRAMWSEALADKRCPVGTHLDPTKNALIDPRTGAAPKDVKDVTIAKLAEDYIVEHYIQTHSKDVLAIGGVGKGGGGRKLLENLPNNHPKEGRMIRALKKEFFTSQSSFPGKTKSIARPEVAVNDPEVDPLAHNKNEEARSNESVFEQAAVQQAERESGDANYKRPDIMNISKRRVYDVTTVAMTPGKVQKISTVYLSLLNDIQNKAGLEGEQWQAGSEEDFATPSPRILLYRYDGTKVICYGSTDLAVFPGVISYEAADLGEGAATATGEPYDISMGGKLVTLQVFPAPTDTDLTNSGPANKAVAESIPGVILRTLRRRKQGDIIEAAIETAEDTKSAHQSTVPLTADGKKAQVVYKVGAQTRQLTLQTTKAKIPIKYKYLSEGSITKLAYSEATGLSGEGYIKPSIPLLKDVDIRFAFAQDFLEIKIPAKKKPTVPIPGFNVTDFNFELAVLPEFKPSGNIGFTIGPAKRALMTGAIKIGADAEGLFATGDVVAHIPGIDETKGTVTYRPKQGWSGLITINSSKIPHVQNVNVTVALGDGGLELAGGLKVALPGGQTASLGVKKRSATHWVYTGTGEFKVPRIKPVVFNFVYDGDDLSGSAKTGFEFKGLNGDIVLNYYNGGVNGSAHLDIVKSNGRLKGSLDVNLNKDRKFSGQGTVSYEIKPGLVASAGIIIDDKEKVTVVGSLTFPPYKLFDQHPNPPKRINIFTFGPKHIPVPFLSFGPLGVQAEIGAGLYMSYGIGPGMIKDGFIKAKVDPLEEDPDPEFELGGRLSIPMFFSVTGFVSGGLVLDVLIAEAGGKLVVSATAELDGEGGAKFSAKYSKGEFKAEADVRLMLELILKLCVDAYAWAEAGVWRFKVRTSKTWNFFGYKYKPPGMRLGIDGLKRPISYSSKDGFSLPSFDDINWVLPSLDAKDTLKSGLDAAGGQEGEGNPNTRPTCPPIVED
jgi:hypothetical protein